MQETQVQGGVVSLLDLPYARLQIVQTEDMVKSDWLDRSMLEPTLTCNADGLWILSVRRQGVHGQFDVPYIGSEILLAVAGLGLVVVLVGYHGSQTEKYGRRGYMTQKGQFYRYYQQSSTGEWSAIPWRLLNDEGRQLVIAAVEEHGPAWARKPGKLSSERNPPTKPVKLTTYKVVRYISGRYYSLYQPDVEYVIGKRMEQPAKKGHQGGFFSWPTLEKGMSYLEGCLRSMPFHEEIETPKLALLEVTISGKIIDYGHKLCATYLCPNRVLEVRDVSFHN